MTETKMQDIRPHLHGQDLTILPVKTGYPTDQQQIQCN